MIDLTLGATLPAIVASLSILSGAPLTGQDHQPSSPIASPAALDPYDPAHIAARAEIEDRIQDWARAVDRRDWALARSVFHPDAIVNHGGVSSAEALILRLSERHASIPMTAHHVTGIRIEFLTDTTAFAESYVQSIQRLDTPAGDGTYTFTTARYADRFERRNGRWKIVARTTVYDGAATFTAPGGAALPDGWAIGRRDGDDPAEVIRKSEEH